MKSFKSLSHWGLFLLCFSLCIPSCKKKTDSDDDVDASSGRFYKYTSCTVIAPPAEVNLSSYYKKYLNCSGIPVIGSAAIDDEALIETDNMIKFMLRGKDNIKNKMIETGSYFAITPTLGLGLMDAPELAGSPYINAYVGGIVLPDKHIGVASMDNILCQGDPNNNSLHEFVHLMHLDGFRHAYPNFESEAKAAFSKSKNKGLWANTHLSRDFLEYIAAGVTIWYGVSKQSSPAAGDGAFNNIVKRSELLAYDPDLYNFIATYFHTDTDVPGCLAPVLDPVGNANCDPTVTDIDGNSYNVVSIGSQCWLKENLRTAHYQDGSAIYNPNGNSTDWQSNTTGACLSYQNNPSNDATTGKVYNFYAVMNSKNICPNGWHIPNTTDWGVLLNQLGGVPVASAAMKSTSSLWQAPNVGATNSSGFTAMPYGATSDGVGFQGHGNGAAFWISDEKSSTEGKLIMLFNSSTDAWTTKGGKTGGLYCRCVKD